MDAFHIRRLRDRVIYYDVRASCWRPLVKTTATRSSAEDWAASGDNRAQQDLQEAKSHRHRTRMLLACHCVEIRSYYRTVLYPSGFGCRGRSVHGAAARASAVAAPRFRRRRAGCRPVAKRSRTVRGDVRPVARQIEYCRQSSRVARVAWPRGDAVAGAAGRAAVRAAPAAGRCPMSRGPDGVGVGRDATHGPRPRHRTTRANRPRQHDPIGSTDRSVPFDAFEFFFNFI